MSLTVKEFRSFLETIVSRSVCQDWLYTGNVDYVGARSPREALFLNYVIQLFSVCCVLFPGIASMRLLSISAPSHGLILDWRVVRTVGKVNDAFEQWEIQVCSLPRH